MQHMKKLQILLLVVPLVILLAVSINANPDLGLILRYVDVVNDRPVLANIYDVKTKDSYEYVAGDYVNGLMLKSIMEDRIVLLDEISKFQYVIVLNAMETEIDAEVHVTHRKTRKKHLDDMDITSDFNREISRADGTYQMYGAATAEEAAQIEVDTIQQIAPVGGTMERFMKDTPLRDELGSGDENDDTKEDSAKDEVDETPKQQNPFMKKTSPSKAK